MRRKMGSPRWDTLLQRTKGANSAEKKLVPTVGYSFAANEGGYADDSEQREPHGGSSFATNEGDESAEKKGVPAVGYSFAANEGNYGKESEKVVLVPAVGYSFAPNEGYDGDRK